MIPAKLIVIVFAMFAIVSSGAIVLSTMTQTAYAQTNHTSTHTQANNTTALSPDERHQQLAEQDHRQQQEQGQQQPPAHAQANNTSGLSSQSPQPECPTGSTSATMTIPSEDWTNTEVCQVNVVIPPECPQGTWWSNTAGACETMLTYSPNQDGQCPSGTTLNTLNSTTNGVCEAKELINYGPCPTGFELIANPHDIAYCAGEIVVEPNCPEGFFFSPFQNECSPNQTQTQPRR
jgi:acyl-CoA synthetase (AMP-forming)/AMP-acid ligase II